MYDQEAEPHFNLHQFSALKLVFIYLHMMPTCNADTIQSRPIGVQAGGVNQARGLKDGIWAL